MRCLLMVIAALACTATLLPMESRPSMLLSKADGVEWKCTKSALILTTCVPKGDVRLALASRN